MKWDDTQLRKLLACAALPPRMDDESTSLGLEARVMADWRSKDEQEIRFLRPMRLMLIATGCMMIFSIAFEYYRSAYEPAQIELAVVNSAIESNIVQ